MMAQDVFIARARVALGARFRLHGRDPATGLDCVGLVAWAAGQGDAPTGYRLRGGDAALYARMLRDSGLLEVCAPEAGDVLLCASAPGQFHLAIWTGESSIHADAALGRVVERPGAPPWRCVSRWRFDREAN